MTFTTGKLLERRGLASQLYHALDAIPESEQHYTNETFSGINLQSIDAETLFWFSAHMHRRQRDGGEWNRQVLDHNALAYLFDIAQANRIYHFQFVAPHEGGDNEGTYNYLRNFGSKKLSDFGATSIAVEGDVGWGAFAQSVNLHLAVYGNVGKNPLLFARNSKLYVEGSTGSKPLLNSEHCVIDAGTMGVNPFLGTKGVYVSRGPITEVFDAPDMEKLLDEAEPLIGETSRKGLGLKMKIMAKFDSNKRYIAKPHTSPFYKSIDYEKPHWIPPTMIKNIPWKDMFSDEEIRFCVLDFCAPK